MLLRCQVATLGAVRAAFNAGSRGGRGWLVLRMREGRGGGGGGKRREEMHVGEAAAFSTVPQSEQDVQCVCALVAL